MLRTSFSLGLTGPARSGRSPQIPPIPPRNNFCLLRHQVWGQSLIGGLDRDTLCRHMTSTCRHMEANQQTRPLRYRPLLTNALQRCQVAAWIKRANTPAMSDWVPPKDLFSPQTHAVSIITLIWRMLEHVGAGLPATNPVLCQLESLADFPCPFAWRSFYSSSVLHNVEAPLGRISSCVAGNWHQCRTWQAASDPDSFLLVLMFLIRWRHMRNMWLIVRHVGKDSGTCRSLT